MQTISESGQRSFNGAGLNDQRLPVTDDAIKDKRGIIADSNYRDNGGDDVDRLSAKYIFPI